MKHGFQILAFITLVVGLSSAVTGALFGVIYKLINAKE